MDLNETPVVVNHINPFADLDDINSIDPQTVESFERDVSCLNRCFDEIERLVARVQQAAVAQREFAAKSKKKGDTSGNGGSRVVRSLLPTEREFVDVLQKFKLSFNLLAKLRNHIREPGSAEILHFVFSAMNVVLEASKWSIGENIAPRIVAPLLTDDAKQFMMNVTTEKEMEVLVDQGEAWTVPTSEWRHSSPPEFQPVFYDGYAPYKHSERSGGNFKRKSDVPWPATLPRATLEAEMQPNYLVDKATITDTPNISRRSSTNHAAKDLELQKLTLERDRISLERQKLEDQKYKIEQEEKRIEEDKQRLTAEERRNEEEKQRRLEEQRKKNQVDTKPDDPWISSDSLRETESVYYQHLMQQFVTPKQDSPDPQADYERHRSKWIKDVKLVRNAPAPSSVQRAFLDSLQSRYARIFQVTHDRLGNNSKELSVSKGEFVEMLNDAKQWWECRNIHNRVGFVPNTILKPYFHQIGGSDPTLSNRYGAGLTVNGHGHIRKASTTSDPWLEAENR